MTAYIGISMILQWRIKYGGCEVIAIPIILFKRRYVRFTAYPSWCWMRRKRLLSIGWEVPSLAETRYRSLNMDRRARPDLLLAR